MQDEEDSLAKRIDYGALTLRKVVEALNKLVKDGLINDYAIGGAIAAAFYIKAAATEDVDAFVLLPGISSGLVLLTAVYEALIAMGGIIGREYVYFDDWPLQLLTDSNPLVAEAIRDALSPEFDGIPTRVFRAEHLCAIALQVGRTKDHLRVRMFLEQNAVDRKLLHNVLDRYGLAMPQTIGDD